ncbi:MAG: tetratricopeptide repeat protein [Candidatus Hodarchaeota archaeon]
MTFTICIIVFPLFVFRSNTGDIGYRPVRGDLGNEQLERNVKLAILDFPDKRPFLKGFLYSKGLGSKPKYDQVGAFWGGYKITLRKLHSNQAITLDVIDALADLFEANGFSARKYYGSGVSVLSDERFCVKGQINEFFINGSPAWRGIEPSILAIINIDVMIIDRKYQRTIWTGKIKAYRKMSKNKGVLTGTSKIISFFNLVFSRAIEEAWIDDGMLKALAQPELYQQGRYSEAVAMAREALKAAENTFGPNHPNMAASLNNLAFLQQAQGKYAEAEPLFKRALKIYEKALGPEHPRHILVATSLNNLAGLYQAQGKYVEAEPLYRQALKIREKVLGKDHPDVVGSLNSVAAVYKAQGKYTEAEPLYRQALRIREKDLGKDHPDVVGSLNNLAAVYKVQGKYAEAEPIYRQALRIREKDLGKDHPNVALSLNKLAAVYEDQGKYAEAERLYKRALKIWEKALGQDHPNVATVYENMAQLCRQLGKEDEAEKLEARARRIRSNQ